MVHAAITIKNFYNFSTVKERTNRYTSLFLFPFFFANISWTRSIICICNLIFLFFTPTAVDYKLFPSSASKFKLAYYSIQRKTVLVSTDLTNHIDAAYDISEINQFYFPCNNSQANFMWQVFSSYNSHVCKNVHVYTHMPFFFFWRSDNRQNTL